MYDIEKAVSYANKIAADNTHGYDQENRLGDPDFDCSSFVARCLIEGGFPIAPDSWTGNLYDQLVKCGFHEVIDKNVEPGDIFLTPGRHVVIAVSPSKIAHASLNEKGGITGGKPGDQTGKEICIRNFYTPSYGWKYHMRYMPEEENLPSVGCMIAPPLLVDIIEGKYGNFPERKENIEAMELDYETVQYLVNQTIKAKIGRASCRERV